MFTTQEEMPAIGTNVVLRGVLNSSVISDAKIEKKDS